MSFTISPILDKLGNTMIAKAVWQASCPVNLDKLRLVQIKHYDFAGEVKQGEIVAHNFMAESALKIFKQLFEIKFPIAKMHTIEQYNGNDEHSMADNNSSCFNYRLIQGSDVISMHSYGLAIDINPIQNPYIIINHQKSNIEVYPKQGCDFLNRNNIRPGMVEPIVKIFIQNGFTEWGGNWNSPIDYHHFQVTRDLLKDLI